MEFRIPLGAGQVSRILLRVVILLIVASILGRLTLAYLPDFPGVGFFQVEFYLDEEGNVPALYSALAMAIAALLLLTIGKLEQNIQAHYYRSWKMLSGIFLYLSMDELLGFHEYLNALRRVGLRGAFFYAWVIPAALIMVALCCIFYRFLISLNPKVRNRIVLSGAIFLTGAIGFEMLGSGIDERLGEPAIFTNLSYQVYMTLEEGLEMLGIVTFIHSLLSYLNQYHNVREMMIYLPMHQHYGQAHPAAQIQRTESLRTESTFCRSHREHLADRPRLKE
ncbi:MAG: hypothetical protein HC860_17385 [Alkalinema sp. RU_4_3]|nr:hypothetical protein [Alkalinema sp. RU_4_3]